MKRFAFISIVWMAFPLACHAEIYKCVIADSIVYQDSPCAEGRNQMRVAYVNTSARPEFARSESERLESVRLESVGLDQNSASQFLTGHEARPILPVGRTTLSLGMSDDEVLNLPGWGRPKKITRNKGNRVWREQWAYVSPVEGEKYLNFTNGKLTAIESERVDPAASLQLIAVTQR